MNPPAFLLVASTPRVFLGRYGIRASERLHPLMAALAGPVKVQRARFQV